MDNGTKNMCQSPVIPVIWLLVTYLICKTGPIAHATPLSLVIWLFGYWWQLICKTGPCISSVTGYLVIWLLTFYYLVFLRPWRLRHFNIQLRHGLHALQIRHTRASSFESLKMLKGSCQKKTFFFWETFPKSVYPPTHPRVFVRFGKTKCEIWVEKGDFRGDLGGF